MSDEVKFEQGGILDKIDIKDLRASSQKLEAKKEVVDGCIIDFDDDGSGAKALDESIPTPSMPTVVAPTKQPTKEEIGGGIVIDNKPVVKESGPIVGPLGPGSDTMTNVQKSMKEYDQMIGIAKSVAAAKGQVIAKRPEEIIVEVLLDKTGMKTVEFTPDEKKKLEVSKKIKVVEIDDVSLNTIKISRPKALKAKTLIQKTFEKQYAPFVAIASGYLGKMRNLSSMEIVNLMSINENSKNSAEAIMQKASLIFSKLKEVSTGNFNAFDDFCKQTAMIDMNVQIYSLIRATYPNEEELMMNCANEKCVHTVNREGKPVQEPNQFPHKYKNNDILLGHLISDKVKVETDRIYEASHTVEDAKAAQSTSILNTTRRFALGEDKHILVDIYCPSIYDMVETVAKKISPTDFPNPDAYSPAINLSSFIKTVLISNDEENGYDMFDDIKNIVEVVYNMDNELLDILSELIQQYVLEYQYQYGFKADTVICPHCGHPFEKDVPVEIEYLLFLQAQRHMTNA